MKTSGRLFAVMLLTVIAAGCGAQPMDSADQKFESMPDADLPDETSADDSGGGDADDSVDDTGGDMEEPPEMSEPPEPAESAPPPDAPRAPASASPGIGVGPFSHGRSTGTAPPPPRPPAGSPSASGTSTMSVPPMIGDGDPAAGTGQESPAAKPPKAADGYVLQKIYYGTDRAPEIAASERWQDFATAVRRFQVLLVLGLTLCGTAFFVGSRRYLLVLPAIGCLLGAAWFGRMSLLERQQAQLDDANQNRRYGDTIHFVDGKHTLERGYCWVSVPTAVHQRGSGQLEAPGIFEVKADPQKHFTVQQVTVADRTAFLADFREAVQSSSRRHAFVFIHGYNVLFEEAALRTAQLKYDLDFDGPAALFSWPSRGSLLSYASDEETVNLTERSGVLHEFLTDFINETGAESIHLIAHSMGNRLLTRSFEELPDRKNSQGQKMINQLIMAAPDVNPAEFRLLADRIRSLTRARTLYASEKDIALIGSEVLRMSNYTRLGQGGESRVIVDGVQTIDASDLDRAVFDLGHSYYVHPQVMKDLKHLLLAKETALTRPWLVSVGDYWTFCDE